MVTLTPSRLVRAVLTNATAWTRWNSEIERARAAYYARFCVNGCGRVTDTPTAKRCRTCIDKDKKK